MYRFLIGLSVLGVALALAGAALAGAHTQRSEGYVGPGEAVQGEVEEGVAGAIGGVLPFSGQDLTLLVVGGVALLLAGTGFYRLSRRRG